MKKPPPLMERGGVWSLGAGYAEGGVPTGGAALARSASWAWSACCSRRWRPGPGRSSRPGAARSNDGLGPRSPRCARCRVLPGAPAHQPHLLVAGQPVEELPDRAGVVQDGAAVTAEDTALATGYWLIDVASRREAVEWVRRFPCEGEVEIRRVARVGRVGHAEPRARGLPASPDRAPMSFPRRAGLYA